MNTSYSKRIGKVVEVSPYKPGGKLLRVVMSTGEGLQEFQSFVGDGYEDRIGAENEWEFYVQTSEWNGKPQRNFRLVSLTKPQRYNSSPYPRKRATGENNGKYEAIISKLESIETLLLDFMDSLKQKNGEGN